MYKKGMIIEFTNKLSGSQYDGEITEVKKDEIIIIDEYDNVFKVSPKWWDIKILKA